MADIDRLLELMHPMREPPPPAEVSPYLFTVAVGCVAALIAYAIHRVLLARRAGLRASALEALASSRDLTPPERLSAQATMLRRLVRTVRGDGAARAEGQTWLAVLDETFATRFFTTGDGAAYGTALYARSTPDVEALDRELGALISKVSITRRPDAAR